MTPYRVAIIGTGDTANGHMNALNQAGSRVEVVAGMDVNEGRARTFCAKYQIPRWFTNADEMLAAVQPDLVHIVTPPGSHANYAISGLQAGAWVFCEKPLCISLAEFDRITQAEADTGRYVSTVFQWRFGSAAKHLKRLIATGEMGRPLIGVCQTLWHRDSDYYRWSWRGQWATEGGGVQTIMGIHLTDLLLWLMGDWHEVRAIINTYDQAIEVENVAMAMIRFENGAMVNLTSSAISPREESYLRLDFQRATVDVTGVYGYKNENWRFALSKNSTDQEALQRWQAIEGNIPSSHGAQVAELLDSIDRNERPLVSGAEARRIIEFLACMYKSAFTGEPVQRGTITPNDVFYHSMNGRP